VGGLDVPARRLLPRGVPAWQGGTLKFVIRVDEVGQNYFTLKLWGGDVSQNQMTLHLDGKQVGYRHLGDIEALDIGTDAPACPGRFHYRTCPLPLGLTQGKHEVECEIRTSGPLWAYGSSFEQYQKTMTEASRGIYQVCTHTDGFFMPSADEKQGRFEENLRVRNDLGPEVIDAAMARVNGEIDSLLKDVSRPCTQMHALFLARAFHVKWTHAAGNPKVVSKVLSTLDALYQHYEKDHTIAQAEGSTYNPDWFGLGPCGHMIDLLRNELEPRLDEPVDHQRGGMAKRRQGFLEMLVACRDWHREHRRQYTNQSMINDLYGIYLANRGIAVLDASSALPEKKARRYLYESVGLEPWLGSEKNGEATKPLGDAFYQLTAKGLTRELGFVGNYGEVLDWVTQIYDATRPRPEKAGDPAIRDQLVKIARARAPFRYPLQDEQGCRAMVQETTVGWRDTHFPGDVTYDQRPSWDGSPFEAAAVTMDSHLVGYAQQMLADHQFFRCVAKIVDTSGFRTTFALMGVPDRYEAIKAAPPSAYRLPMSWNQADFVFSDEDDGVVAVKHGREILYASLYWRARHAVNFLSRVHFITPEFDRIATVKVGTQFTPSGFEYTRPDWTDFGFAKGGHRYPSEFTSAHAGEKLPIARVPEGLPFRPGEESLYAGRGDLYQLQYGSYWITMNMSSEKSFEMTIPRVEGTLRNLENGEVVQSGNILTIRTHQTWVLHFEAVPLTK